MDEISTLWPAMRKSLKKSLSGCPIDYSLDIFGDRWTLLLIRDLLFAGKRHFGELMQSPERIASNILAARLRMLEERGLVVRSPDPESRKQVVYELTEKGRDLTAVLVEMIRWGGKYDPQTPVPKSFVKQFSRDNEALMVEVRKAMSEGEKVLLRRRHQEK